MSCLFALMAGLWAAGATQRNQLPSRRPQPQRAAFRGA
jgi:hypothetical protein